MGSLTIVTGPSCIGKGPLCAALNRFYPALTETWRHVVLYNDRAPRPGEVDGVAYRFRRRGQIEELRQDSRFLVMEVRGDLQAVDLEELRQSVAAGDVFYEGNPFVARALLSCDLPEDVKSTSVFLSPLSREEIVYLSSPERHVALPDFVADVMRRKLLRRMQKQKGILSGPDLDEAERRCGSAYSELKLAHEFGCVIPNHDGEDSENWDAFDYPVGDARRTMLAVAELLQGQRPAIAETWEPDLFE